MNLFNFDPEMFLSFILTFLRISIVLFMLPFFSIEGFPGPLKASVCLVLTIVMWNQIYLPGIQMPAHPFGLVLLIIGEVFLGIVLGLAVNFFFAGIQAGGEMLATQMGFTMISLADPLSGNTTGFIAHFLYMVAILTFLTLNGHLFLLKAFTYTFKIVPAGGLFIREILLTEVIKLSGMIFVFALHIAAPVMSALFLVEVSLGIMARAAPQLHIMEVGFPAKIGVGFFFIGLLFVLLSKETSRFIIGLDGLFYNLLTVMKPSG